jgi:hypothetical protein
MEADNQKEEQPITVATYRPAQFAAADWEVVSDDSKQEAFCAEVFESVALNQHVVDPMFADFTNDLVRVEETKVAEQPEFKAEHVQTPAEPQTRAVADPTL